MKKFLILVILVALVVWGGWAAGIIKFSGDSNTAKVEVDKQKAKDIAENVKEKVEAGAAVVKEKVQEGAEKLKEGAKDVINKVENKTSTTVSTTPDANAK